MAGAFTDLLEVQDRDLTADQLRHRRATLPERARVEAAEATLKDIDGRLVELDARLGELGGAQEVLEDEIASVSAHIDTENAKLYGGAVTAPRELEALQSEITVLGRRRDELEERLLEVMEAGDAPSGEADALRRQQAELSGSLESERSALSSAERAIDDELAAVERERGTYAAGLPADLLERYDALRRKLGGIGAARLEAGRCTGCHLTLPATELDAAKRAAPDALILHEECGRILVR